MVEVVAVGLGGFELDKEEDDDEIVEKVEAASVLASSVCCGGELGEDELEF